MLGRLVITSTAAVALAAPAVAQASPSRYALAGGCYQLIGASGTTLPGADKVRMQASGLGRFLLYRDDRSYLASTPGGLSPLPAPDARADWSVGGANNDRSFPLTPESGSAPPELAAVRFVPAKGCAVF